MTTGTIQLSAQAARVDAKADAARLSATIVLRPVGFLAVRVLFHGVPMEGLEVKFSVAGDDGSPGDAIGEPLHTDARGVAAIDWMVATGRYACEIERQPVALVTTVDDLGDPYPVVLPVGRPYVDFDGDAEHVLAPQDSG